MSYKGSFYKRWTKGLVTIGILLLGLFSFFNLKKMTSLKPFPSPKILAGHDDEVNAITFSPDGGILATGGEDKTVKLWDIRTDSLLRILTGHQHGVFGVSFSPDGKMLASGSTYKVNEPPDGELKLWDVRSGKPLWTLTKPYGVGNVEFSPDGKMLAIENADPHGRTIKLRNGETQTSLRILKRSDILSFSPDSSMLATWSLPETVELRNALTGAIVRTLTPPIMVRPDGSMGGDLQKLSSLSFSPNGKILVVGGGKHGQSGTLRVWNTQVGTLLHTLTEPSKIVKVAFSPDGKSLASLSEDGTLNLWDTKAWVVRRTNREGPGFIKSLAFSPDGKLLAGGGRDGDLLPLKYPIYV